MTKHVAGLPAAGRLTSLLVVLALCGSLPGAWAHVCDSLAAGTRVCDPDTNGAKYYVCMGPSAPVHYLMSCGTGLVFHSGVGYCDWPSNTPDCVPPNPSPTTTTSTSTTPTTSTTTTPTTPTTTTTTTPTTPTTTTTTTTTPTTTSTTTTPTTPTTTTTSTTTTTTTTPKPTTPPPASTTTTTTTTEPTASPTTKATGGSGNPCAGVAPYSRLCDPETNGTSFLTCVAGRAFRYECPQDTFFRQATGNCDWRRNIEVMCVAGNTVPTRPATTTATTTTTTTTTMAPLPSGACDATTCQLPDCRCVGTDIPGHLPVADVPQMVLLTFDDGINTNNASAYNQLFLGQGPDPLDLKNPNLCPTAATFFVSNDHNDMDRVRALCEKGHEMASHSQTHGNPRHWDSNRWQKEMQGMREQLAQALGVSVSEIQGLRTPYLELGKETQFSMMRHNDFTYDSSMFGGSLNLSTASTPVWPFTLDFPPNRSVCAQTHCPERSYPGVWEVPLIRQYGWKGEPCSMTDSCPLPAGASAEDVRQFLRQNFLRHYESNRAPFMISLHATWFGKVPGSLQGLKDFLREVNADPDVWQVTVSQMLDWVRHPVPQDRLHELLSWKACA